MQEIWIDEEEYIEDPLESSYEDDSVWELYGEWAEQEGKYNVSRM